MNRQQRRAALKQKKPLGANPGPPPVAGSSIDRLFAEALWHQHQGNLADAAKVFKHLLAAAPEHAEAWNNFGVVLRAQGKTDEAAAAFQQSLALYPQLLDDFGGIANLLISLNPTLGASMKRAEAAWPVRLAPKDLFGPPGIAAVANDRLLHWVLRSTTVRSLELEWLLASLRQSLLQAAVADAAAPANEGLLDLASALASQCFINEYAFAQTPDESELAGRLRDTIIAAASSGSPIAPFSLLVLAMYHPLHALPVAPALLQRQWAAPVAGVVTQQIAEPGQERELRSSVPRLTAIDDQVSLLVQSQYEENPYPRWVYAAAGKQDVTIDEYLHLRFPASGFRPLNKSGDLDILVAGCGTGRHPIEVAQLFKDTRVLAVDLSLTSLCYALRKTPRAIAERIEYAQADILKLASIDRTFDVVEAGGVLHHMADPLGAWHTLLTVLRPGGFMRLGFYSELARRDVAAARVYIAERGYRPTDEDIRRCRQDLLSSPFKAIARSGDFFSISDCRDLLFHVQEHRLTLPQINSFIGEHGLKFIGFVFGPQAHLRYRETFAAAGWSMEDLERWHAFETEHPDTFAGMYQFWVQKT